VGDLAAGLWAALAAAAGLAAARADGEGRTVEVPLLDSTMSLLAYLATGASGTAVDPEPVGSGHHELVPYRAFACRDGWIVITVLGDRFWPLLCRALGLDDLAGRDDLATAPGRVAARREIEETVAKAVADLERDEALDLLRSADVPAAPVATVLEALDGPYAQESGAVVNLDHDNVSYKATRGPVRPRTEIGPAPGLGQHTEEILAELEA
jgi:formyl-CoA transferase/CoA:oxalate CoA-transferase